MEGVPYIVQVIFLGIFDRFPDKGIGGEMEHRLDRVISEQEPELLLVVKVSQDE